MRDATNNYRGNYRECYIEKNRQRKTADQVTMRSFWPEPAPRGPRASIPSGIPDPFAPGPIPGMIGGAYDIYPHLPCELKNLFFYFSLKVHFRFFIAFKIVLR